MAVRVYVTGRVRVEFDGRLIDERQLPARQGRILTDPSRETQAVYHEVSTGLDLPARMGNERGLRRDP